MSREPGTLLAAAAAVYICLRSNGIDPLDWIT